MENRAQSGSADDELSHANVAVRTIDVPIRADSDTEMSDNLKEDAPAEVSLQLKIATQLERPSSKVEVVDEGEELQLQEELKELESFGVRDD